jgi:hypothetical protein
MGWFEVCGGARGGGGGGGGGGDGGRIRHWLHVSPKSVDVELVVWIT